MSILNSVAIILSSFLLVAWAVACGQRRVSCLSGKQVSKNVWKSKVRQTTKDSALFVFAGSFYLDSQHSTHLKLER